MLDIESDIRRGARTCNARIVTFIASMWGQHDLPQEVGLNTTAPNSSPCMGNPLKIAVLQPILGHTSPHSKFLLYLFGQQHQPHPRFLSTPTHPAIPCQPINSRRPSHTTLHQALPTRHCPTSIARAATSSITTSRWSGLFRHMIVIKDSQRLILLIPHATKNHTLQVHAHLDLLPPLLRVLLSIEPLLHRIQLRNPRMALSTRQ